MLEQEVKLAFDNYEAARAAVLAAGARLVASQRLQDDCQFDNAAGALRTAGCTLRLRRDGGRAILTFKGPALPGPVKSREETETGVADPDRLETILASLGYTRSFRYQKRRETYRLDAAAIEIDVTPIGTFVEIEATPAAIERIAGRLGRTPADYSLDSYRALRAKWCEERGQALSDMLF